ncbi:hypothetical protein [Asticcacaulis sp. EMRT-3]|nr:hypothetical protein [Asticcacaulis sp. EMRT-3]MDI7775475.1 hypothetical protein [Asticcacaulis sp. EMRT-3]
MNRAKAITMKQDKARELMALATSAFVTLLVLDIVSLLIGGVLRPLMPEW